jgi:hypothetical protein
VLDDACHRSRLAGARTAGQHDLRDFISDFISHYANDNFGFTKRKPKLQTILHPHNLSILKDVKNHIRIVVGEIVRIVRVVAGGVVLVLRAASP